MSFRQTDRVCSALSNRADSGTSVLDPAAPVPASDGGRSVLRGIPVGNGADYRRFLEAKVPAAQSIGWDIDPLELPAELSPHAKAIVQWAVRKGRAAIFAGTGLHKSRMQVEWLHHTAANHPGSGMGLIFAPLAVADQTIREAAALNIDLQWADQQPDEPGLYISNYDKMHRFDPNRWAALALDESSILKNIAGATREKLVNDWTCVPYRLCCTATPAPNDIAEIANHSEFLGVMKRRDLLATYFLHDDLGWRLKGHARADFFRWMASWAVYIRKPSDLGFSDEGFDLPMLNLEELQVAIEHRPAGQLFPALAAGIQGRTAARRQSLDNRVAALAERIKSTPGQWLVWCGLNDESKAITMALGAEAVEIEGADTDDTKLSRERAWRTGEVRVLVTKPSMFGWGLNWQHCHRMAFLGLSDSWEQYYQAIRRCWRFGQTKPVDVVIVVSDAEGAVVENVRRKEEDAETMAAEVVAAMGDIQRAEVQGAVTVDVGAGYQTDEASGQGWRLLLGDCCERLAEVETDSVGLSVHSPPFAQLYTYSASVRDLGNTRNYQEFFRQYRFAVDQMLRVTMPGRRACVHVQQIAQTQVMHGKIKWYDFRADVRALYEECGWDYHGEVVIDKDPQAQAIRTKSKTLLFVQKNKDSSWSIPAMADYILLFRKPGDNEVPVLTDVSNEEWIRWARPVWYGIRESATLQAAPARGENDEKHIAPLQLETVERCIRLWSNKGETVLDPFNGIGTTGYEAVRHGRQYLGIELKPEYWRNAVKNLREAELNAGSRTLFDLLAEQPEQEPLEVPA